ncbi:hypothetical protein [Xanthomonas citri]|nr:hypothetical protein [Xanthomonas citri]
MSKAKTASKPGRTKTFSGTLPRGIKASQAVSVNSNFKLTHLDR